MILAVESVVAFLSSAAIDSEDMLSFPGVKPCLGRERERCRTSPNGQGAVRPPRAIVSGAAGESRGREARKALDVEVLLSAFDVAAVGAESAVSTDFSWDQPRLSRSLRMLCPTIFLISSATG